MAVKPTHTSELIQYSSIKDSSKVFDQWEIEGFEILHPSEAQKKCFCGNQTRNICYIRNTATDKKAQIALECAETIKEGDPTYEFLKAIPKVFEGCKRILVNFSASASEELVEFAHEKAVFTEANKTFYDEHAQYTYSTLPRARQKYRQDLNQLLVAMGSSAKLAYNRLNAKETNIAAPRLIEYAFEKRVLSVHEKQLYLNLWKRVNIPFGELNCLGIGDKKRLINLNARMLSRLKEELLCLPNGQLKLSAFFGKSKMPTGRSILSSPPAESGKRKREEFEPDSEEES